MSQKPSLSEFLGLPVNDDQRAVQALYNAAAELHIELPDDLDLTLTAVEVQARIMAMPTAQRSAFIRKISGRNLPGVVVSASETDDAPGKDMFVCKVCRLVLNEFSDAYGKTTWIHSRSWEKQDHEPVPEKISRETQMNMICDFCARDDLLNWEYTGKNIRVYTAVNHTDNSYGNVWRGCDRCDEYIARGDVPGLIDRIIRTSPVIRRQSKEVSPGNEAKYLDIQREHLMELQEQFIPSIHKRMYVGPPVDLPVMGPRQIPKIRDGLVKFWRSDFARNRLLNTPSRLSLPGFTYGHDVEQAEFEPGFRVSLPGPDHDVEAYGRHVEHLVIGLHAAALFYISRDFTQLAIQSGGDLPDLSLTREELPTAHGLIVWADPIGEITRPEGKAFVHALTWTLVPGGVWLNIYFQPEDGDPAYQHTAERRQEIGWLVAPNTGLGLPWANLGPMPDSARENILSTLLATWFLMRQPGVADETPQPVDKALHRSYKRAGRPAPDVRIVDLRRHNRTATHDADTGSGRKISVRFMVRGHWKRQAYGAKRGLRKTIYVQPFVKGPDNAPFKLDIPTVQVLR